MPDFLNFMPSLFAEPLKVCWGFDGSLILEGYADRVMFSPQYAEYRDMFVRLDHSDRVVGSVLEYSTTSPGYDVVRAFLRLKILPGDAWAVCGHPVVADLYVTGDLMQVRLRPCSANPHTYVNQATGEMYLDQALKGPVELTYDSWEEVAATIDEPQFQPDPSAQVEEDPSYRRIFLPPKAR